MAENRATRTQHEWTMGSFAEGDRVTLYCSDVRAAVSLDVSRDALRELRVALRRYDRR